MIPTLVADKATGEVKKLLRQALAKWEIDRLVKELKESIKKEISEKAKTDAAWTGGEAFV